MIKRTGWLTFLDNASSYKIAKHTGKIDKVHEMLARAYT